MVYAQPIQKKIKIRLVDIILEDATKLSLGTTIS